MIEVQAREAGRWLVATTATKFADPEKAARASRRWEELGQALFLDAVRRLTADPTDAEAEALLWRYTPRPGGNQAASAIAREVIERYWDRAFGLDQKRGQVIDAEPKYVTAAELRKIAETELDGRVLLALAEAEGFALGARNGLLNEGINELWELVASGTGGGAVLYNNANAEIGVGDSAAAFAATQTDLEAATNKNFQGMVGGFPTFGTSQKANWKSSFAAGVAAFSWQEWSIRNGNTRNRNLNRKVENLGTKSSTAVWTLECEITLS